MRSKGNQVVETNNGVLVRGVVVHVSLGGCVKHAVASRVPEDPCQAWGTPQAPRVLRGMCVCGRDSGFAEVEGSLSGVGCDSSSSEVEGSLPGTSCALNSTKVEGSLPGSGRDSGFAEVEGSLPGNGCDSSSSEVEGSLSGTGCALNSTKAGGSLPGSGRVQRGGNPRHAWETRQAHINIIRSNLSVK